MTDRDHFAAAALTGMLASGMDSVDEMPTRAYRMADAMLRERERTNHDAAPAARASEATASPDRVRVRGDAGTGDTPATHATPPQGIEPRECTEPVAWAVMLADGERIYDVYATEEDAKAIDEAVTGNHGFVPLYRSPTLTDAEREAIRRLLHWVHNRPCSELPDDVETDHSIACEAFERLGGER